VPGLNPPFSEYLLGRLQKTAGLFPCPGLPGFRNTRKAGNVKKLTFLFCRAGQKKKGLKRFGVFLQVLKEDRVAARLRVAGSASFNRQERCPLVCGKVVGFGSGMAGRARLRFLLFAFGKKRCSVRC
jgi:hypothetical protein